MKKMCFALAIVIIITVSCADTPPLNQEGVDALIQEIFDDEVFPQVDVAESESTFELKPAFESEFPEMVIFPLEIEEELDAGDSLADADDDINAVEFVLEEFEDTGLVMAEEDTELFEFDEDFFEDTWLVMAEEDTELFEFDDTGLVMAEEDTELEEPLPEEDDELAMIDEPSVPAVTAVPQAAPIESPPSVVSPPPAVQPPQTAQSPQVTTSPQTVDPPTRVVQPSPERPAPVPQTAPVLPPVEAEPPVIVREPLPLPRDGPELPNPTPAFTGRQEDKPAFSRIVRARAGQLVEIPFRGTNWVYLGEVNAQRGIMYDSRRLDPEGQSFVFKTETPGEYALKFFRQDFIRDYILNDYVQVVVGDPPEDEGAGWFTPPIDWGRVIAEPRWPSSLAEAQAVRSGVRDVNVPITTEPPQLPPETAASVPADRNSAANAPVITTPPAAPPSNAVTELPSARVPPEQAPTDITPESYLDKAQEEFSAGRVDSALSFLDRFRDHYGLESDELLWFYGQFYEANSPSRNILAALNYYRRLVQEYPQSSRYDDARRRIAYLQRYYIQIN